MTGKRAQSIVALKIKKYGTDVVRTRPGFVNQDAIANLRVMILPVEPEQMPKIQSEAGSDVQADKIRNIVVKGTDDVREEDTITVLAAVQAGVQVTEVYRIGAVTPVVMQNVIVFYNAVGAREA